MVLRCKAFATIDGDKIFSSNMNHNHEELIDKIDRLKIVKQTRSLALTSTSTGSVADEIMANNEHLELRHSTIRCNVCNERKRQRKKIVIEHKIQKENSEMIPILK
ncbi:hypothetical protein SNEBB_002043 [Seison nebaliae]|nr:hypothetical protein SNEBB_002043 [Seison nebaliae]